MKKIIPLLLILIATTASAQSSFTLMPEIELGYANLKLDDNINCFNYKGNITIGISKNANKGSAIAGLVFGRSQYTHTEEHDIYNDQIEAFNTRVGSWLVGTQYIYRKNCGFILGGIVGLSILDKKYKVFYGEGEKKTSESSNAFRKTVTEETTIRYDNDDYDSYETPSRYGFTAKGKIGYGWKHIYLLVEAGYNKGFEIGADVAFPLFNK